MRYEIHDELGAAGSGEAATTVRVTLEADEQVTLTTGSGNEYDVCRKSWGFYGSPSFRTRMARYNLRPAFVGDGRQVHFMAVENRREDEFHRDLAARKLSLIVWLDELGSGGN